MSHVADKTTEAFINVNPTDVVLTRHKKVRTPDGGFKRVIDTEVDEQRCRVIMSGNISASTQRMTPDGKVAKVVAKAMFMPGADVQVGDLFPTEGDTEWLVTAVETVPRWRVTAEVSERA